MDFTEIWNLISPYLGAGTIGTGIIALIGFFCKGIKAFKDMRKTFTDTNAEALNRLKNALPPSLTVSLENITKSEFAKIKAEISDTIKKEFIEPIKANDELLKVMAEALAVSKLTPDEYKEKIKETLNLPDVETTNSLKVELNPIVEAEPKEKTPVEADNNEKTAILVD